MDSVQIGLRQQEDQRTEEKGRKEKIYKKSVAGVVMVRTLDYKGGRRLIKPIK